MTNFLFGLSCLFLFLLFILPLIATGKVNIPEYQNLHEIYASSEITDPLISPDQLIKNNKSTRWIELGRGSKQTDNVETMLLQPAEIDRVYLDISPLESAQVQAKKTTNESQAAFRSQLTIFGQLSSDLIVEIKPGDINHSGTFYTLNTNEKAQAIRNCRVVFDTYGDTNADGTFDTNVDKLICFQNFEFDLLNGNFIQFVRIR